ncbi:MAG: hypothetical protein AAF572_28720 [Cyanobacteria bacterium P01_B01_bin.77]
MDGKQLLSKVQFDNDFGTSPMGLGLLLKDAGLVGLGTVVLSVLALPVGGSFGIPLALAVAYMGANDCKVLSRHGTDTPLFQTASSIKQRPPAVTETPGAAAIDLPRLLASSNSSIIMGAPRAGKGYAVAQALRMQPETCTIWLLDPKNDPREHHYWSHIDPAHRLAFNNLSSTRPNDARILEFITEFFDAAVEHGNHLLIIDEVPALSNMMAPKAFKKMMGLAASTASSGPSLGIRVWLVTQDSTCDQMGFSAQSRACFAQFAVSSDRTPKSWLAGFCQSTKAPHPTLTGYIAYDGERWGNSKQYPNVLNSKNVGISVVPLTQALNSRPNSPMNSDRIITEFDPTKPESEQEFNQFRELVCGGLEAGGNEIINRLWKAKPGGSKRYQAARQRRDQFIARLSEYS